MPRCTCPGFWEEHTNLCSHHKPGEPCPNPMVPTVRFVTDPRTRMPVSSSQLGKCQVCRDNFYDKVVKPEVGEI